MYSSCKRGFATNAYCVLSDAKLFVLWLLILNDTSGEYNNSRTPGLFINSEHCSVLPVLNSIFANITFVISTFRNGPSLEEFRISLEVACLGTLRLYSSNRICKLPWYSLQHGPQQIPILYKYKYQYKFHLFFSL